MSFSSAIYRFYTTMLEIHGSINMGSLYMNQKGGTSYSGPFPEPRDIGKIIRRFREWPNSKRKGDAYEDYSYLSEFTHPNMAALSHYYKLEPNHDGGKAIATLVEPPRGGDALRLAEVTIAVAATLSNLRNLSNYTRRIRFCRKARR